MPTTNVKHSRMFFRELLDHEADSPGVAEGLKDHVLANSSVVLTSPYYAGDSDIAISGTETELNQAYFAAHRYRKKLGL